MPWFEESCECEWVVCKLCTPPISIIGLKPLRLVGIGPAAGLAQGIDPPGVAEVPVGTVPARGTAVLWVPRTGPAGVPAGTVRVRGIDRPWAGRGIGPVGIVRPGAGPSYGCS